MHALFPLSTLRIHSQWVWIICATRSASIDFFVSFFTIELRVPTAADGLGTPPQRLAGRPLNCCRPAPDPANAAHPKAGPAASAQIGSGAKSAGVRVGNGPLYIGCGDARNGEVPRRSAVCSRRARTVSFARSSSNNSLASLSAIGSKSSYCLTTAAFTDARQLGTDRLRSSSFAFLAAAAFTGPSCYGTASWPPCSPNRV